MEPPVVSIVGNHRLKLLTKDGSLMELFKSRAAQKGMCLILSICFTGLIIPAEAKKVSFQLPSDDKITEGEGPLSETKKKAESINLAPVGLHDDEKQTADADAADPDAATLKSTVTQTDFKAKGKAGSNEKDAVASGKKESVIDKKALADKVGKPKRIDVGPLALQPSESEEEKAAEIVMTAEQRQLSELWQSTIDRNPDIQFVIQKLQPTSDANHAMAGTMKLLSGALFGAMNMAPFMMPGGISQVNPAALMGMSSGTSMIQGLFADKAQKSAKKQAISQEQATILYQIVRNTADKLVASYRDYKKEQSAKLRAATDLQDLQTMAAEAHAQDPAKAIEMEYTLRKAKRDIDEKIEQERLYHQQLVDLAGGDAVIKLDKDLEDERMAIANGTGSGADQKPAANDGPFVNPLKMVNSATDGKKIAAPENAIPQ